MPKATRKRIATRGQVEVSTSTGSPNVPASVRAGAMAPSGGRAYVSSNSASTSAWANLSGAFRELARQAEKADDRAYAEAQKQEARAYAREEAKLSALESAAGLDAALQFTNSALEKMNSGAYSNSGEMLADFQGALQGLDSRHASFIESYTRTAGSVVGPLSRDLANKLDARTTDNLMGTVAQSQRSIYENLDNLTTEQFVEHHKQLLQNSLASGTPQHALEEAMVTAFANEYGEATRINAERASKLYDMGKEWSKTLTSRSALDKLSAAYKEGLSHTVDTAAREEQKAEYEEAKQRKADYASLFWDATRLDKPEAVLQQLATWEADPDLLEMKLGPELAAKLVQEARTHQEWLENRDSRDWQLRDAEGKKAMGEYEQRLYLDRDLPTLEEMQADDRLLPYQRSAMWQTVAQFRGAIEQGLDTDVANAKTALRLRMPADGGWVGGYSIDEEGAAQFEPEVDARIDARLKRAAFEAFIATNPDSPEGVAQRSIEVKEAMKTTVEEILKNGHMYNFEVWEATREKTGGIRPKVSQELNVEAFPEQKEDIEKMLFSRKSGAAAVQYGPRGGTVSVDFNVKYYLGLPPEGRELANEMLILKGKAEYEARAAEFDASSDFYKRMYRLTHSNDPAILSRDRGIGFKAHKYDVDLRQLPPEQRSPWQKER